MPRMKNPKPGSLQKDPIYTSDNFRMYCFKIMPCSKHYSHDWTECPFAHPGEKATRRDPRLYTYVGIECPCVKGEAKSCPRGDNCPFAHNVFECWLHPSRYRTQMCNEPATCRRKICFFAHKMEEIRQPSPVSQDMEAGKPGPKRVSTSPEKRTMRSPPPETRRQSCDGRLIAGQTLTDYGNRGAAANELPPRPRMSVESARPNTRPQPTTNPMTQQPQQFSSAINQSGSLVDQLQTLAALCQQQQQQQENLNSLDLAAAMEQMSLYANQPAIQTTPVCPSLETGSGGSSQSTEQFNALLIALLQQQFQNNNSNINPSLLPSLTGQLQAESLLMNNPNFSNPATSHLNSLSNNTLLLQHLQAAQGLGGMAGFRSSLDSTLSNGSGSRIPARVSYDGVMSPPVHNTLQHLAEFNSLNQKLSENPSSAPDFIHPGSQQRSSTESSYTDSYGQWSMDAIILDSLKASESMGALNKSDAMTADQLPVEDFISFNQGSETFASANTTTTTSYSDSQQQQQQHNSPYLSS